MFLFEMLDNSIRNVALPTIGRRLSASTAELQWVTGVYAVVFGGLMPAFGALADRVGRRKIMLLGLVLLGAASLATSLVTTAEQLIAVRAAMGVAAAMTTPGSLAQAFRLLDEDTLRVRATTLISTVGLVGLAIGPTAGGFVLAFAPWQALLLVNVRSPRSPSSAFDVASPPTGRTNCTATPSTAPVSCSARPRSCPRWSHRRCSSTRAPHRFSPG
ncbi:MFS transporter [Streptomyces sp. NPDC079167]|uniref:MFS transporter n=1 Tax=Streptomyces sp. NPDC079167 TaxID=3154513 RepID=UPI0034403909